jgi:HD-like signal output (HDOD) protein
MPPSPNLAVNTALRRLAPLQDLSEPELAAIAEEIQLQFASGGERLLDIGSDDEHQLFLIQGELELFAEDGASHIVSDADQAARGPISRLRPSRYRVTARTAVTYVLLDLSKIEQTTASHGMIVEESIAISAPNELTGDNDHPLLFDIFSDINAGTVVVPSYSAVAVRVGRALHRCEQNQARFVETLTSCPTLALKTLRSARAASSSHQIPRSIRVAVERFGVDQTYALAVSCVLRETLRSESDVVENSMRGWWQRSIKAAAVGRALARNHARFDIEFATMVSLLQTIAEPVMLGYADRHQDLADNDTLRQVIHRNRAELGRILLTMWSMPRELIDAAAHAGIWRYNHAGEGDYVDLALVAHWFAGADDGESELPPLDELPAAYRLGLRSSTELREHLARAARDAPKQVEALLSD